jgi:hypothetical protein
MDIDMTLSDAALTFFGIPDQGLGILVEHGFGRIRTSQAGSCRLQEDPSLVRQNETGDLKIWSLTSDL